MQSVCEYNGNIAEYGLAVAGPATNPQTLTAMLIGPVPQTAAPVAAGWSDPRAVQPATATEPLANPLRARNEPTPAPPRDGWRGSDPTPAPTAPGAPNSQKNEPTLAPPRDGLQPVGKNEAPLTPPGGQSGATPTTPPVSILIPAESSPSSESPRTVRKPASTSPLPSGENNAEGAAVPPPSPLYPALVDAPPSIRAKQLTIALHWDRSLPEGSGKPISLADCISRQSGGDRRATIDAYWLLRQRAAEYQVLLQEGEMLEGLVPAVLDRRHQPAGAAEMLQLRAAQTAAQAAAREARVALVRVTIRLGAAPRHDGRSGLALGLDSAALGPLSVETRRPAAQPGRIVAGPTPGGDDSRAGRECRAACLGRGRGRRRPSGRRREVPRRRSFARSSHRGRRTADGADPGTVGHLDRVQPGDRRVRAHGAASRHPRRQARGRAGTGAVKRPAGGVFYARWVAPVSVHGLDGDWSIFRQEIVFGEKNVGRKHGPVPFRAQGDSPIFAARTSILLRRPFRRENRDSPL